ncbi:M20 family metallopeptidase [Oceanobacillus alkalisoli]|uniref:M20 family metallopeptidase n=1 Tax=Oceanobacillus alkalisoli TaxID=2925113 RepID=UPI001EE4BF64|nr:M20 family metallopeptidase [Oceanobacillus alkalisoli]MCG5105378.1 M20 family metallopeptidase [Oceanobacillus alkalisoli]
MQNIYQHLEAQKEEMYAYLEEIVNKESPSHDKELVDELGSWLAKTYEKLTGGTTTIIPDDVYGNHIRGEWGSGESQILILGHFDTIWPKGTINKRPFKVENGKAVGPGVFDMKGGIIQGLFALKALKELNIPLNKKIVFLFDSDEEIGNPSSRELIEKEAAKSDYVFVLEPGMTEKGSLKTSRKGVGIFNVEATGLPAHAGIDPEKGVSAIHELALQILDIEGLNDFKTGTTFNVGKISGGTGSNVIPEKASAEIDLRAKTQVEFERAIETMLNLKPKLPGSNIKVTGGANRGPLERTEEVISLFKTARHLAKKYILMDLTEKETGGGSDGNLTAPLAPTLDGLGAVGDGAHAHHEYLILSEMPKRSALLAMLLATYGN